MKTTIIESYTEGKVRLVEQDLKDIGENEILLRCIYSTISPGTELAWIWHMSNTPGNYPYYPGYSSYCIVEKVGCNVCTVAPGDAVIARTFHCSFAVMDANQVTRVDKTVDPIAASSYRLASISLQSVRKADIQIGDNVAVIGLGAIGNFGAQISQIAGAINVTGFDMVDWRRHIAHDCGIISTEPETDDHVDEYDIVFEATGVPSVVNAAIEMVKPLGKIILLGSSRGLTDGVNFYKVHRKGISIIGAHEMHRSHCFDDRFGHFRSNIEDESTIGKLMEHDKLIMRPLISDVVSPHVAQEAYNRLKDKQEKLILISFDWSKL